MDSKYVGNYAANSAPGMANFEAGKLSMALEAEDDRGCDGTSSFSGTALSDDDSRVSRDVAISAELGKRTTYDCDRAEGTRDGSEKQEDITSCDATLE